jgi:hypothetical protein
MRRRPQVIYRRQGEPRELAADFDRYAVHWPSRADGPARVQVHPLPANVSPPEMPKDLSARNLPADGFDRRSQHLRSCARLDDRPRAPLFVDPFRTTEVVGLHYCRVQWRAIVQHPSDTVSPHPNRTVVVKLFLRNARSKIGQSNRVERAIAVRFLIAKLAFDDLIALITRDQLRGAVPYPL